MVQFSRDARRQRVTAAIRAVLATLDLTNTQRWNIYQLCDREDEWSPADSRRFADAEHLTIEAFLRKTSAHPAIFLNEVEQHHGFPARQGDAAIHDELAMAIYELSSSRTAAPGWTAWASLYRGTHRKVAALWNGLVLDRIESWSGMGELADDWLFDAANRIAECVGVDHFLRDNDIRRGACLIPAPDRHVYENDEACDEAYDRHNKRCFELLSDYCRAPGRFSPATTRHMTEHLREGARRGILALTKVQRETIDTIIREAYEVDGERPVSPATDYDEAESTPVALPTTDELDAMVKRLLRAYRLGHTPGLYQAAALRAEERGCIDERGRADVPQLLELEMRIALTLVYEKSGTPWRDTRRSKKSYVPASLEPGDFAIWRDQQAKSALTAALLENPWPDRDWLRWDGRAGTSTRPAVVGVGSAARDDRWDRTAFDGDPSSDEDPCSDTDPIEDAREAAALSGLYVGADGDELDRPDRPTEAELGDILDSLPPAAQAVSLAELQLRREGKRPSAKAIAERIDKSEIAVRKIKSRRDQSLRASTSKAKPPARKRGTGRKVLDRQPFYRADAAAEVASQPARTISPEAYQQQKAKLNRGPGQR